MAYGKMVGTYGKPQMKKSRKVLVALSGGVDSAVAAALLKNQGLDVIGLHMQLWDPERQALGCKFTTRCCQVADRDRAKGICQKLEIPFVSVDGRELFEEEVLDSIVHEAILLRTPNACFRCNERVRIPLLMKKADELGCATVATGHYAQLLRDVASGQMRLAQAVDRSMDQSHLLFGLTQDQLGRMDFPVGGVPGAMVQKLAEELGVSMAKAHAASQSCFVKDPVYFQWLEQRVAISMRTPGMVRTPDGQVIGEHFGALHHPVGEKANIPLATKDPKNFVVLELESQSQVLVVGPPEELKGYSCLIGRTNWIIPVSSHTEFSARASINGGHQVKCKVLLFGNRRAQVNFEERIPRLSAGEAIVFYEESELLGGGWIETVGRQPEVGSNLAAEESLAANPEHDPSKVQDVSADLPS